MAPLCKELGGVLLEIKYFGAHLDDKGNTTDLQLELKNFEQAGKILDEIWSGLVMDSYPVTAKYIEYIGLMQNESVTWEVMPEVFNCSVREIRCLLISQTKHLNTSSTTSHGTDSFCVKPITPDHPIPKISTRLFSEGVPERQSSWKQSTDKRGHNKKKNQMDSTRNAQ